MTLRLRLTLAVVALVAVALVLVDAATYVSLRSFLLDRVDQQLEDARIPIAKALSTGAGSPGSPFGDQSAGQSQIPPGTYGELRDATGAVLVGQSWAYSADEQPIPDLPESLPDAKDGETVLFSADAQERGDTRFRVLAQDFPQAGLTLVVAIPLSEVQETLARLLLIGALFTVAALVGLGALASWLVRRGLRPLEDMATTAGEIAAGDLSRRVEPAEDKTEVGRLGLALNAMLEQIEEAFEERRRSEEKLRRFLADASHELRTPLTSIRGYAEVFRRGAKDDPTDLETAMRRIEDESRRMGVLVDELLRLARLGEGREPERAPVDLARIVADVVSDAAVERPERTISVDAPEDLVLTGDKAQLHQVVANLVGNALRHTPPETPVVVRLRRVGDWAELEVADEGPGMAAEDAARVFEPFYRADKSRARETGGTGLGLAIVAAIVDEHGGTVTVETAPGAGATFRVRLPAADAAA
ncbi:MAG TPA: ATP-binding protein [Thermoleophilia bacterium]|nr:ATP-binding protein [Thermoleophilia bacterium]